MAFDTNISLKREKKNHSHIRYTKPHMERETGKKPPRTGLNKYTFRQNRPREGEKKLH